MPAFNGDRRAVVSDDQAAVAPFIGFAAATDIGFFIITLVLGTVAALVAFVVTIVIFWFFTATGQEQIVKIDNAPTIPYT